jgi:hypothetical protein
MPPRYAYWTIIVDNQPTAFRSGSKEDLTADLQSAEGEERHRGDDVVPERQAVAVACRCAGSDDRPRRDGSP